MGGWLYLLLMLWAAKGDHKKRPDNDAYSAQNSGNLPPRIQISLAPEHEEQERAYREKQHALQQSTNRAAWWTFWAVLIYAGITLAIFCVTKKAADAAKNAAVEAKLSREQAQVAFNTTVEQFRLEQRAWLAIDEPRFVTDGGIDIAIEFSNSGRTPAFDVTDYHTYQVTGRNGKPSFPRAEKPTDFVGSIPPGGKRIIRMSRLPIDKVVAEIGAKGQERTKELFIFGTIWYKDAFGNPHYTQFCMMSFASACPFHNDTDEAKH